MPFQSLDAVADSRYDTSRSTCCRDIRTLGISTSSTPYTQSIGIARIHTWELSSSMPLMDVVATSIDWRDTAVRSFGTAKADQSEARYRDEASYNMEWPRP